MNGFNYAKLILWAALIIVTIFAKTSDVYAAKPKTIPSIQEWTDGAGSFNFSSNGRIVLDQSNASQLATTGSVFQENLLALKGVSLPIVIGSQSTLKMGDIFLSLGATDATLGSEGYYLTMTDRIVISAKTDAGAFYGTRTVLQMLKQGSTIGAGTARDYPRYPLRGLHVDNGRKFVTVDWLKNHIIELAYFKMNLFHWHLAEWNNFRLESSTHPEIVAIDHYSKAEVQEMLALAAKYHIIIMPEFEMPGHMNWALSKNPNLKVSDSTGRLYPDYLDLTNRASYTFVSELLNEWLPLFPGPYFHIGTDEYITDFSLFPQYTTYAKANFGSNANAKDLFFYFINWVNDIVRTHGKTMWVWDDSKTGGSVFSINKNIIFDSWTFAASSEIKQGYSLINSSQSTLYYLWFTKWEPMQTQLYEQWAPNQWAYTGGGSSTLEPYTPGLLGAKLELWFDNNACEQYSMAWGMRNPMRTVAQQTWASPKSVAQYSDFKTLSDQIGHAPSTSFPATLPPIVNPNGPYNAELGRSVVFSSAGTSARNGSIVGYRWNFGDGGTSSQANPTYTYSRTGTFNASLLVTDSNQMNASDQATVTIASSTPVSVTISPSSVTLATRKTQTFIATVTGSSNTMVTWSALGGGAVNANGLYTAPATAGNDTVRATSVADTTKFASAAITVVATPPNGNNLALNKPTIASSQFSETYAASKATDDDAVGTRWCARAAGNGEWIIVDLGSVFNLTGTEVKWESNGVWKYKIESSQNGAQWTVIVDRTNNALPAQVYNDNFAALGRYVRITATTTQTGHWASIYDFKIFGS